MNDLESDWKIRINRCPDPICKRYKIVYENFLPKIKESMIHILNIFCKLILDISTTYCGTKRRSRSLCWVKTDNFSEPWNVQVWNVLKRFLSFIYQSNSPAQKNWAVYWILWIRWKRLDQLAFRKGSRIEKATLKHCWKHLEINFETLLVTISR